MRKRSTSMESRLLFATLWRRRGTVFLAVAAVAIGAAVATALLDVSRDVGRKLTHELRALGPNLLVVPSDAEPLAITSSRVTTPRPAIPRLRSSYLDEREALRRLRARPHLLSAPVLDAAIEVNGHVVDVVGTDLVALRQLHPSWKLPPGSHASWMGARLMRRLGVRPGERLTLRCGARSLTLPAGAPLEAGGAADEAWWIPLPAVQWLTGLPGRVSLVQVRSSGDPRTIDADVAALGGGGIRAVPLHALSATEAELLDRTRRLMTLVTVAVLVAAGLCAFGTLTDLALERRREVAVLKALGATRRDLARLFGGESAVVGLLGGALGWLLGTLLAQLIGRQVFHAAIAISWRTVPLVLVLSSLVALVAAAGPIRLALAVDPAPVLKGD